MPTEVISYNRNYNIQRESDEDKERYSGIRNLLAFVFGMHMTLFQKGSSLFLLETHALIHWLF